MAVDVHARRCVIGWMDSRGKYRGEDRLSTSESALIRAVVRIEAHRKVLAVEEGSLALWVARTIRPYVDELIVCDPRENDLISKNVHKSDGLDTYALCRLARLGELKEFVKVPGMGPKGSHVFDAIIQTPHRFSNKRKIWRYCGMGVVSRTSDGKPLGYQRLDKSGHGELKAIFFRAVQAARRTRQDNEVKTFYEASLDRTQDRTKARLNTQRKILSVLYGIWKRRAAYQPKRFLKTSPSRRVVA